MEAATICKEASVHLVDEAVTGEDGTFVIPSFDSRCGKIRLTAEKRDAYWLQSGEREFYPRPNGTAPELTLNGSVLPDPVTIQLDLRGGELELLVWDEAAARYIHAGLNVECLTWCGTLVQISTGLDGAAHTMFIPARRYKVSLYRYSCGTKTYFPERKPTIEVDVVEGELRSALLKVDVTTLPAKPSYDNPRGVPCRM